jgi:aspartate kinase
MEIIVKKFGGTSVGSVEKIENIAKRLKADYEKGENLVVVVSAMSGETNRLLGLAQAIQPQIRGRELDTLLATGEQVTIALLAIALEKQGLKSRSYAGFQVPIQTDSAFNKARIQHIAQKRIIEDLQSGIVVVVAGFQGIDAEGNITTLGRGGSDTTAVALAAALKAKECQIFTDVDGVYTTDPRLVPTARRLDKITFEEMLEMASLGSKVLQIRSVEFAGKYRVPLRVLSTFQEGNGTLITFEEENVMEQPLITGIAFNRDEAQLTVTEVPDQPGVAFQILGPIAKANIEVDMIVQNVGAAGHTDFTFTVHQNDFHKALDITQKTCDTLGAKVVGNNRIAKVSIVGVGMRSHAGVASLMFETLFREGINILMISTSEIKISVVIAEKYLELAVKSLHEAFGLDRSQAEMQYVDFNPKNGGEHSDKR